MLRLIVISGLLALISLAGKAQDTIQLDLGGYPVKAVVQGNDTVLIASLGEAVIQPHTNKPTNRDMRQYRRLVYNVKKVYPYAKLAGEKFAKINAHMDSLETKREQREYIKKVEKDILQQYEADLKDLTITQGRILIKLIDRETSETSYEVVKDLRGSFQAALWQTVARIFGSNLKTQFDAAGEDRTIDEIMVMIERGQL
jgi:uncharacterized ubiquitin-like protein YukD